MPWIVAGAAVGGSLISGAMGSSSAKKAASAQKQAAREASRTQMQMFEQGRRDQAPWRDTGAAALNQLSMLMGLDPKMSGAAPTYESAPEIRARLAPMFRSLNLKPEQYTSQLTAAVNREIAKQKAAAAAYAKNPVTKNPLFGSLNDTFGMDDFQKDPGYQFRMDEGMKGLNNSTAARGGVLSGAALKAASRYNQDFASNEYSNAYNRFNNDQATKFNRLSGLAGTGQQASQQIANQGISTGNQIANNQLGAGNARASGYIGQANAWSGAIGQGFNMYQQNRMMNQFAQPGRTSFPSYSGWSGMGGFGDSYGTSYGE